MTLEATFDRAFAPSLAAVGLAATSLVAGITGYGSAVAADVKGFAGQMLGIQPDARPIRFVGGVLQLHPAILAKSSAA